MADAVRHQQTVMPMTPPMQAAYGALHGLFGADLGGQLVLAAQHPGKEGEGVAAKGDAKGQKHQQHPRIAGTIRSRSRQESIRGTPARRRWRQVTAAKGMPCSSSYRWMARAKGQKMNTPRPTGPSPAAGAGQSAPCSQWTSPGYTHTGTAAAPGPSGDQGLPLLPRRGRISSQAPMAHMAATSSMVAQDGPSPASVSKRGAAGPPRPPSHA